MFNFRRPFFECCYFISVLWIRDPVLFGPLDPDPASGMVKNPDPGSGFNIPDYISESLGTSFGLKILKFFDPDPGSGIF
jgi:hypothetical protein